MYPIDHEIQRSFFSGTGNHPAPGRLVQLVAVGALTLKKREKVIFFTANEVDLVQHPGEGRRGLIFAARAEP